MAKTDTRRDSVDAFLDEALGLFPTLDADTEAIVDRIGHLRKYFDRLTKEGAKDFGLNHGEFHTLVKLRWATDEGLTPGALAERLVLSTGAMTNRLDRLEEAGLVRRDRDPSDRRGVIVSLTAKGRETIDRAVAELGENERRQLAVLSPDDRRRLNGLLRTLMLSFEDPSA
jgi:DNA-binding MarR family transcriptional regulator